MGCDLAEVHRIFDELTSRLEADKRTEDLLSTYQQFIEVLPHNDEIHFRYANALFKNGSNAKALAVLETSAFSLRSKDLIDTIKSHSLERWHFPMLNDKARNLAFFQALQHVVTSEDMVLDVGTGTGLLSLFAAKANAKKVVACEVSEEIADIAEAVFVENNVAEQIDLHRALSTQLNLVGLKGNVLVTETFDAGLLGEHALEIVDHAWKHLLCPKAVVIPSKARVFYSLGCNEAVRKRNKVITRNFENISFDGLSITSREMMSEPYDSQRVKRSELASEDNMMVEINFNNGQEIEQHLRQSTIIRQTLLAHRNCIIDCIVLWFQLILDPSEIIRIGTSPEDKSCWEQAVFPLIETIEVAAGDQINVEFELKGHFTLKSVEKVGRPCLPLNGLNLKTELTLPRDSIKFMNAAKPFKVDTNSESRILDFTDIPLISLNLLKSCLSCELTMLDISKDKVDLVSEIAASNGIQMARINGISRLDEDFYDIAIFDPILMSGRLNQKAFKILKNCQNVSRFVPSKMTLKIVLIESEDLMKSYKVPNDSSVLDFKIALHVNSLSINHVQNIRPSEVAYEILSEVLDAHEFVFSRELSNLKTEIEASMVKCGAIHAALYWFDIRYNDDYQISTLNSEAFDVAAILLPTPIKVETDDVLTCEFTFEEGLMDLRISSE